MFAVYYLAKTSEHAEHRDRSETWQSIRECDFDNESEAIDYVIGRNRLQPEFIHEAVYMTGKALADFERRFSLANKYAHVRNWHLGPPNTAAARKNLLRECRYSRKA